MEHTNELDLLLDSIREVDKQISLLREQLNEMYGYRQMLVDQLARQAAEMGYGDGYSNGEYRMKVVHTVRAIDPESIARIAPGIVEAHTEWKVDGARLRALWNTELREQLAPYVAEEQRVEVTKENRKTVQQSLSERPSPP